MTRLGKYELLERLAVGGMAELFKARLVGGHGFKKTVVVKKILPQLAANDTFVNMFVDEARITALLDHPNIVQVFEFGQEGDELFLVMQLVDGTDLFDVMGKTKELDKPLPIELCVYVACEILDALDYAHNATDDKDQPLGIIHRDVSPGNVLVSNRGNVMLTDFGIAWAYERHQKTEAGKLKGKFGYMSPEQVAGDPIDGRSDLFSTAILLAEMLINRHLFVGQSDLEILLMVRDADLERLVRHGSHVPFDLMAIVHKALSPRPAARYQNAAEFREALAEWLFNHQKRVSSRDLAAHIEKLDEQAAERGRKRVRADIDRTPGSEGPRTEVSDINDVGAIREEAAQRDRITGPHEEPDARPEGGLAITERNQRPKPGTGSGPNIRPSGGIRESRVAMGSGPRPLTPRALGAAHPENADIPEEDTSVQDDDLASSDPADQDPGATIRMEAMDAPPLRPSSRFSRPSIPLIDTPTESGDFATIAPVSLLYRLASRKATGLLTVEHGNVAKEAYFKDGSPQFVGSNVPQERLGQYLLARNIITQADLDQALQVMPHFGGHLLDSLISRNVLEPLDALRHLAGQVSAKLMDVCNWTEGSYQWFDGRRAPRRARRLQLDTYEIVGRAVLNLEVPRVVAWAKTVRTHKVKPRFRDEDLSRFGMGDSMVRARVLLENHSTTVVNLAGRVHDPAARLAFVRALYLLAHCGLAHLEA